MSPPNPKFGPTSVLEGDGGITPLFHVGRPQPAAPQHERWALWKSL